MDIQADLIEQQWENAFGESLPSVRFFTANDSFWEHMKAMADKGIMFVEGGAGSGHTTIEAKEHGIKMTGCDIYRRDDHDVGKTLIQPMPAHRMPYMPNLWPIVCRPDHSGWVAHLFEITRPKGCGFIYVGHREKVEFDVGDYPCDLEVDDVGEEGEVMFIWFPEGSL